MRDISKDSVGTIPKLGMCQAMSYLSDIGMPDNYVIETPVQSAVAAGEVS